MLVVEKSDLAGAMRTVGWLNLQTGAVIYRHRWIGRNVEHSCVPVQELEGDISQYIRLPCICPVQKRIHYVETRQIEERLLRKHGLENYLDLKRDEKLLYPSFYGDVPITADGIEFLRRTRNLFRDDDDAMKDPKMGPNEADTQFELDLFGRWALTQGFDLVGSWKSEGFFLE